MTWERARPIASLAVLWALTVLGLLPACGSSANQVSGPTWNACEFTGQLSDQLMGFGSGSQSEADMPWAVGDAGSFTAVAELRCLYERLQDASVGEAGDVSLAEVGANDAGNPGSGEVYTLAILARLSLVDDRPRDAEVELLAEEGFSLAETASKAGDPEVFAIIADPTAVGPTNLTRTELHRFVSPLCPRGTGSFHEYFIVAETGSGIEPQAALARAEMILDAVVAQALPVALDLVNRSIVCLPPSEAGADAEGPDVPKEDAGIEASAGLPITSLAGTLTPVYCARLTECCPSRGGAGCAAAVADTVAAITELALRSVTAGNVSYSPQAAAACVDRLASASCAALAATLPAIPCLDSIVPLLPVGAVCNNTLECVAAYCRAAVDGGVDAAPGGWCTPQSAPGEACSDNEMCASGSCSTDIERCTAAIPTLTCGA